MSQIKDQSLTPEQITIIRNQATERPGSGEYNLINRSGSYLCRACGRALFRADAKFSSGCGWPSFDVNIDNAVVTRLDQDGFRQEILCAHCHAHLGHVFDNEGFTAKNRRYCVNSLSLDFVDNKEVLDTEEAIVAGGCFWGVDYYFQRLPGVMKTESGYIGGHFANPSYEDVCSKTTGHVEALRIIYSPDILSYEDLIKYFFEIHDPTQVDGQGPDLGPQYLSAIFYYNNQQKQTSEALINTLVKQGFAVATKLLPMQTFWKAEAYHQSYYEKTGKSPYCHAYVKRF